LREQENLRNYIKNLQLKYEDSDELRRYNFLIGRLREQDLRNAIKNVKKCSKKSNENVILRIIKAIQDMF
jgi:hypothetical protein